MTVRRLPEEQWNAFCAHANLSLSGKRAIIEILSLASGHSAHSLSNAVLGMAFHRSADMLQIMFDRLDYFVCQPRQLFADERIEGIVSIAIIDANDVQRIITLHDPLMLPALLQ